MLKCGLLGKKLGHSRSPEIHRLLGDYAYRLYEKQEESLEDFILHGDWNGLNVTIPYKKTVLSFVDVLSPTAQKIGSVNTLVRRRDGRIYGDNTDVAGFEAMLEYSHFNPRGEKVLILGSGGASVSVQEALLRAGALPVIISRNGENNYQNLEKHRDAAYLVNTTPVGMFPEIDASPLDLSRLPSCRGVLDIIYNPPVTRLMRQAAELGLPAVNGLYMLVAQARRSAELFTGKPIANGKVDEIFALLRDGGTVNGKTENTHSRT